MAHTKWSEAAHAKAFETLKTDKSKEAAAKLGIEDPSTSEQCIGCHTTPTLKPEEGVSCEACHGPAEKYLKPHGKINPAQRPPKEELVKMGMKDLTKKEDRVALCMECHKEDERNPFNKPFDYDEYWKKIDHGKKSEEEKTE